MNISDVFNKGFLDSSKANLTPSKLEKSILSNNDTPAKGTLTKRKLSDEFDGSPCAKKINFSTEFKIKCTGGRTKREVVLLHISWSLGFVLNGELH